MSAPERICTFSGVVYDSARWNSLMLRAGDIIFCSPPNCGTTWTQKLCALLVHQNATLPHPLTRLSRWLDRLAQPNVSLTRCRDISNSKHHKSPKDLHMRALKVGIVAALLASPAYADRKKADACAAGLSPDSKVIYAAAVGKMRRGADNEAVVTAITLSKVSSGRLSPLTAKKTAEAAGDCLKKLAD